MSAAPSGDKGIVWFAIRLADPRMDQWNLGLIK